MHLISSMRIVVRLSLFAIHWPMYASYYFSFNIFAALLDVASGHIIHQIVGKTLLFQSILVPIVIKNIFAISLTET